MRTVRLDEAAEEALARLCERTGRSASEVMRDGVRSHAERLGLVPRRTAFEIYESLGLPRPNTRSLAPARDAKEAVAEIIRRKHGR